MNPNNLAEYDSIAEWCAKRNLPGNLEHVYPINLSIIVWNEIVEHNEEFQERVLQHKYAIAMNKHENKEN